MNNQEKFRSPSNKLKSTQGKFANEPLCSVWFSTDIPFSSLGSFAFCLLFFCFFFFVFFWKIRIYFEYILIHIRLWGLVSDKNIFTRPISGNKTTFFFFSCGDNLYDQMLNNSFHGRLKSIQHSAALPIIRTIEGSSREKLELGLESLHQRWW